MEAGNIFVPNGWTFWFRHSDEWSQPEGHHCWRDHDPIRVHSGNGAYMYFAFHRKMDAGLMKQVQVTHGDDLRLSAFAHSWSNHQDPSQPGKFPRPDDPRWSEGASVGYEHFFGIEGEVADDSAKNFTFSIGIDPTGGTDPFSDTVVWGEGAHIYNAYHAVPSVRVEAQADTVTVFLESRTLWPFKHNDAYWDDILLERLGQADPPVPEPPPSEIWQYSCIAAGSKLGIHGTRPNEIGAFVESAASAGAPLAVVKAVDDMGWLRHVKQVSPNTITIGRFTHSDEGCQNVGVPGADLNAMADILLAPILNKVNQEPDLRDVIDYWEVANEPDPPQGPSGYDALSRLMIICMEKAEAHGLKIGIFSLNNGTGEYNEMVAMAESGVFSRAYLGGHILCLHEGPPAADWPMDMYYGDLIPGAPTVSGAGSFHFRYKYLYEAIRQAGEPVIPLVISELYAALHLPSGAPPTDEMVNRIRWWDERAREDYYVWGCCPFTLGPVDIWVEQDWEYCYPALIDYAVSIRDSENATPPLPDPGSEFPPLPPYYPGGPREQYARRYILLPEDYDNLWAQCAALGGHPRRYTIGYSPDDAGIGTLDDKRVVAINPGDIGDGLTQEWFDTHYPGTVMETLEATTPWDMAVRLLPELVGDITQAQSWYDVDFGEHPGGGTIQDYGCLLTACAIVLRSVYDKDVISPWLDKLFVIARSVFTVYEGADHIMIWNEFVNLFPAFDDWQWIDGSVTIEELRELLDNDWQVVLRRGSPGSAHFVYLENIDEDGIIRVIDTQDGERKPWSLQWITGIRTAHVAGQSLPTVPPLIGIHDEAGGEWMVQNGVGGLCLCHGNVTDAPAQIDMRHLSDNGIRVLYRLNHGYGGGAGTLPPPDQMAAWVNVVAQTIQNAQGMWGWILGNEQNHPVEWPNGQPITPQYYTQCYNEVWERVSGQARLTPGAIDPYNAELMDPRDYITHIYENIHGLDFIALHGKTQGSDPAQCWSYDTFTDPPLVGRYYHLRTLKDQLSWILQRFWGVPVYVTELNPQRKFDGSNGWEGGEVSAEWVRQAYAYCHSIGVNGVIFYRWADDEWAIGQDAEILNAIQNL